MVLLVGIYLFLESFTAVNEMPKIKLREIFCEFKNLYTIKYIGVGLYGLLIAYNSTRINGWGVLLVLPAIFCVIERTVFRLKHSHYFQYLIYRFKHHDEAK